MFQRGVVFDLVVSFLEEEEDENGLCLWMVVMSEYNVD